MFLALVMFSCEYRTDNLRLSQAGRASAESAVRCRRRLTAGTDCYQNRSASRNGRLAPPPVGRSARRRCGVRHGKGPRKEGSMGVGSAIEKTTCNGARGRLPCKGPSNRASAGRATPVAAPAPHGSNLCFRRDTDTASASRTLTATTSGRTVQPGGQLQASRRASHFRARSKRLQAAPRRPVFAARIRTGPRPGAFAFLLIEPTL